MIVKMFAEEFLSCPTPVQSLREKNNTHLVPYLPVTPTFLVLFVIFAEVAVIDGDVCLVVLLKFLEISRLSAQGLN